MDPDITTLRLEERAQRAARTPCSVCGGREHVTDNGGRTVCYECRRAERAGNRVERDHVAGRANVGGLLVDLWANDHRTVTELRLRIGMDKWPPAVGDPLLTLAHVLAGVATLLLLFAQWLLALAADAKARLGTTVWEGAPLAPVVA